MAKQAKVEVKLINAKGQLNWDLEIKCNGKEWEVSEKDLRYSLFSNPLAVGPTIGIALENFLKVQKELLASL